jgi:hypothetical protein
MKRSYMMALVAVLSLGTGASVAQIAPFGPSTPDVTLDAKAKKQALATLTNALENDYPFPEVGDKVVSMLKAHEASGEYASITSAKAFSELLTKEMAEIAHDKHLGILYSANLVAPRPPPPPEANEILSTKQREMLAFNNYSLQKAQRLDGNVGLLQLNGFTGDTEDGGDTLAGAMVFLANTGALIIDLRDNHGGAPGMVALLASYFFGGERPMHLNDMAYREKGSAPRTIQQFWTQVHVSGRKYLDKDVYILTSQETFSAAEEFTYDMQALKRATVVGAVTAGGANPGRMHELGSHLAAFIPNGTSVNAVTGTNWEGKGIQPDVNVAAQDALKTAYTMALQHLIDKTSDPTQQARMKQALALIGAGTQAQPH